MDLSWDGCNVIIGCLNGATSNVKRFTLSASTTRDGIAGEGTIGWFTHPLDTNISGVCEDFEIVSLLMLLTIVANPASSCDGISLSGDDVTIMIGTAWV